MTAQTVSRISALVLALCLSGLLVAYRWTSIVSTVAQGIYGIKTKAGQPLDNSSYTVSEDNESYPMTTSRKTMEQSPKPTQGGRTFDTERATPNTPSTSSATLATLSPTPNTTAPSAPRQKEGLILQWAHPWWVAGQGPHEGAKFGNCRVTYNRSRHAEALAVVFHYTNAPRIYPYSRDPKQFFVWHSRENPWVVRWMERKDLLQFDNGFFNWTMTYRRDSDVYDPIRLMRKVYNRLPKGNDVIDKLVAEKKRIAMWVVSACSGKKGAPMRIKVSDEIAKVIPSLERHGKCFDGRWDNSKMAEAVRESKFYLSFENSLHCRDYITEKFYRNGFEYGAVPVVWGTAKEDYLAVAPPHSFIHVEDFASPTELAKYLLYLDSNDTAYREYFKWREEPEKTWDEQRAEIERHHPGVKTRDDHTSGYEKLCEMVLNGAPPKVIPSLRKVFLANDSEECTSKT